MRRRFVLGCTLAVLALSGCGGSSGVTPAAYVKSICSAIGPFEKTVQSRSSALNLSSIKNPAQGKTALHTFLTAVAGDTETTISQLKAAGTPKVTNGNAIQNGIVSAFTQLRGALLDAATKASSLPTSSPKAFKTAADALGTSVRTSMSSIGSGLSGLRNPALEKAAASEPSCKALAGG